MKTSESIVNLAEAFVKFQEEITDPKLDADTDYVTKTGKKSNSSMLLCRRFCELYDPYYRNAD